MRLLDNARLGDQLFILPGAVDRRTLRAARGAIVLAKDREPRLLEGLSGLHDEVIAALRQRSRSRLQQVQDAKVEVLLTFVAAWRRYGERFERDSDPDHPLGLGVIDRVERDLMIEIAEALRVNDRAVSQLLTLPWSLAMEGHRGDAPALTWGALRTMRMVAVSQWPGDTEAAATRRAAIASLFAYIMYALEPALREAEPDEAARAREQSYMDAALGVLADIERDAVDRNDLELIIEIDDKWHDTEPRRSGWPVAAWSPTRWLHDHRSAYRLAVLAWAMRRLPLASDGVPLVHRLSAGLGELADVVAAGSKVLEMDSNRWDRWRLEERVSDVGVLPPFDPLLVRAVSLALLRTMPAPGSPAPPMSGAARLATRRDQIEVALGELLAAGVVRGHEKVPTCGHGHARAASAFRTASGSCEFAASCEISTARSSAASMVSLATRSASPRSATAAAS